MFGWERPLWAPLKTKDNEVEVVWRRHPEGHDAQKLAELDGKQAEGGGYGGGGGGGEDSGGGRGGGRERWRRRWRQTRRR